MTSKSLRRALGTALAVSASMALAVAVPSAAGPPGMGAKVEHIGDIADISAEKAHCGPGSSPETGLQGDIPAADRASRRSTQGYDCNLTRVGGYIGRGGGIVSASFDHCVYVGSLFPGNIGGPAPGVQVLDVSDPRNPALSATLTEPAMLAGTWETLKVNTSRKLLVGAGVPLLTGAGLLSIYDVSDCAHPRLLNPGPGTDPLQLLPITAHEGAFSPDGNTYWASGVAPGLVHAVDLTDPSNPRVVWQGMPGLAMHGMGISDDGNRVYLSDNMGGLVTLDSSAVQRRDPNPQVPVLARMTWSDGWATQHSIPVTYDDHHYLFTVDEAGSGGVKLIDVEDDAHPRIRNTVKLEINLPENQDSAMASSMGGGVFGYDAHYCTADRPHNPTAMACGWVSSGVRVFDVRDPFDVHEIAYYNPPAQTGRNLDLWNSPHAWASIVGVPMLAAPAVITALTEGKFDPAQALSSRTGMLAGGDLSGDWCFSGPLWRGNQLWTSCSDNAFLALELDPSVYTPPPDQRSTQGS
ncbi:LVIVD repeat-containing protein [Nocardia wallacei]|uniref:LVIVD repeat-containing protein n=1 Tax=Nocardia wallacei TaxID=480035 RepID=UPI003CC7DB02